MKRFLLLSLIAISLLSSFSAFAQTPNITMTTSLSAGSKITFSVYKTAGTTSVDVDFGNGTKVQYIVPVNQTTYITGTLSSSMVKIYINNNTLTNLECPSCSLTALDVSNCTTLTTIKCNKNNITSLNVSSLTNLDYLDCSENLITSLSIKDLSKLSYIYLNNNRLTSLTVENCAELWTFNCNSNSLTSLDLGSLTFLSSINCDDNKLTNLTLPKTDQLKWLSCKSNQLQTIDVYQCIGLETLICNSNKITVLDITGNTKLSSFDATNQSILLTEATATLGSLSVSNPIRYNNAEVTDITPSNSGSYATGYIKWTSLSGQSGNATYTFSANSGKYSGTVTQPWIAAAQTTMATMNTTNPGVLIKVYWTGTGKVAANGTLLSVNVDATITAQSGTVTLVTAGDVKLTEISCPNNALTALDVTKCVELTSLICNDNKLTTINTSNNTKLIYLKLGGNLLTSYSVANMPALEYLYVQNNKLTSLTVYNCPKLGIFFCNTNQISSLDCSTLPALNTLSCKSNLLTSLSLTANPLLEYIDCYSNYLKTLDLSKCPLLESLYCYDNQITNLDVSKCTKLTSFSANPQTLTLPQATAINGALSVNNTIYYNGALVASITPSNSGNYANGKVSWSNLTGQSGNVTFNFVATNGSFAGTITQPWIAAQSTPVEEHPSDSINIFSNTSTISIMGLKANQHISVYGVTGTLIYQTASTSNRVDIDIPAGIYIVKIDNQSFKVTKR